MENAKVWENYQLDKMNLPSPEAHLLAFVTSDSDPDSPTWIYYPGDNKPLVGRVMLAGLHDQLLVKPVLGDLICINGRAVKLIAGTNTPGFKKHVDRFRHSIHRKNRNATVKLITQLLTANQRPSDAKTSSFVQFTRCSQATCGFILNPQMVTVKKHEEVPKGVFYIRPEVGQALEDFITENNCLHLLRHRNA